MRRGRLLALLCVFLCAAIISAAQTCTPPAEGAIVCNPPNNATVTSPVHFLAAANSPNGMGELWTYVDDGVVYKTTGTNVDVQLTISPGAHNVRIQAWDNIGNLYQAGVNIDVASASTTGGTVQGTINSITDGHPLSGAQLTLGATSTTADVNGNYVFTNVAPGPYTLNASTVGFLPRSYAVSVANSTVTFQSVQLSVAGILAGTVKDTAGAVISGATVQYSGGVLNQSASLAPDSGGGFNTSWIPVGGYSVTVSASGYRTMVATVIVRTGQTSNLQFALSAGTTSQPADTAVNLSRPSRPPRDAVGVLPVRAVLTYTTTQQFTTNAAVNWSVDGIVGGNSTVGTISEAGLYTPPRAVAQHTITATSQATSAISASAPVWVTDGAPVVTQHNDNYRTGAQTSETVLTPANVNSAVFGLLTTYAVDGYVYAQPLYVPSVSVPGLGYRNLVFVATEHDSVYAFDADARSNAPIWQQSFIDPDHGITTASTPPGSGLDNESGITSTPVIDVASGTIYVVAATNDNGTTHHRLHALDIATGADKFGGPVIISATVAGTGDASVNGQITFDAAQHLQRPALLLANGSVYIAFGSYDDRNPYHGWVFQYSASTLAQVAVFNDTPNGSQGGVWMSGGGMSADVSGNVYVSIGNGTTDGQTGGVDWGDAVVKFPASGLTISDYFIPYNYADLQTLDYDLGSGSVMLLPDGQPGPNPNLAIAGRKGGALYLLNRDSLGHFQSGSDSQIVQELNDVTGDLRSSPAFWNGYVYIGGMNDSMKALQLQNGQLTTSPTSQTVTFFAAPGPPTPAISSNGTSDGIAWALEYSTGNEVLHAYDAADLNTELYNSLLQGTRDFLGMGTKFAVPTIADGKVFVGTAQSLAIFGLLPK